MNWRRRAGAGSPRGFEPTAETADARQAELVRLLAGCARGDEAAFTGLYDQTSTRIYGTVKAVLLDPELSAEVTQEVFVEFWRHAAGFDPERGSVTGWMVTIAHRRAVDRVRAERRARERESRYVEHNAATAFDSVAEAAETSAEAEQVRAALGQLTDVQREALQLTYFGGCTHTQAAERLGVPLGTMKTRLRDGLIRLRDAMEVTR